MSEDKIREDNKKMATFIDHLLNYTTVCSSVENPDVQRDFLLKINTFIKNFKEENK